MVLQCEEDIFILIYFTADVVDLVLQILAFLIQPLRLLGGSLRLLLLLRCLDLVFLNVFHQFEAVLLELDLRGLDRSLLT